MISIQRYNDRNVYEVSSRGDKFTFAIYHRMSKAYQDAVIVYMNEVPIMKFEFADLNRLCVGQIMNESDYVCVAMMEFMNAIGNGKIKR